MRKGFTLIEITIVLAILAIVTGVMLPSMGRSSDRNLLDQAAQSLVSDVEVVKTKALSGSYSNTTRSHWGLEFCNGGVTTSYQLKGYNTADGSEIVSETRIVELPNTISIDCAGTSNQILFERFDSNPSDNNTKTVTLNKGSLVRTITVDGISGKINLN